MTRSLSVLMAFTLAVATGCVSKSSYEQVKAERDALLTESQELADVAAALDSDLALRDQQVSVLEREQQELQQELQAEIVAGQIGILLMKDGLHLRLPSDVLFPSGSTELTDDGRKIITKVAAEISDMPYQIVVAGYSDNVPIGGGLRDRFPSNWELAAARASSVVRLIEGSGIDERRLVAVSFGEARPVASNDTAKGRAENRRIDIRLRPVVP